MFHAIDVTGITQGQLSQVRHFWIAVGIEILNHILKVQNLELNSLNHIAFGILALFWPFGNFGLEDFRLALMLFGNPGMMSSLLMVTLLRSAVTVSLSYCSFRTPFKTSHYRHTSTRSFLIPDRPISGAGAVFRDTLDSMGLPLVVLMQFILKCTQKNLHMPGSGSGMLFRWTLF